MLTSVPNYFKLGISIEKIVENDYYVHAICRKIDCSLCSWKKKKGIILLIDVSKKETCNQNISPFNKIARTTVPMTENEPKYFGLYELES